MSAENGDVLAALAEFRTETARQLGRIKGGLSASLRNQELHEKKDERRFEALEATVVKVRTVQKLSRIEVAKLGGILAAMVALAEAARAAFAG